MPDHEFDWIPRDAEGVAALKERIKANRAKAVKGRDVSHITYGITHDYVCGCQILECGEGDYLVYQCAPHAQGDPATPYQRIPDYADVFCASFFADWALLHAKSDA